jgi:hypothetical protein
MSGKYIKIINYILYALLGVSLTLVLVFYLGNLVPGTEGTSMEEPVITETLLRWAYVMAIGAAIITVGFSIFNMIINPKGLKQGLFVLVGVVILFGAAYLLASDQILSIETYEGTQNEPITLKWTGTGLYAMYILAAGAVLSILYSEIAKYFK